MIERTINELGGVFGQLAAMVQEQGCVPMRNLKAIETDPLQRTNPTHRRQH